MSEDKRKYRRVTLAVEDGYFGKFSLDDGTTLMTPILSLSAGGLQFALPKAKQDLIQVGSRMHLKQLSGTVQLSFLSDLYVEVRWVDAAEVPNYVAVGCELLDLSDSLRDQIIKFVDVERKNRGQYR